MGYASIPASSLLNPAKSTTKLKSHPNATIHKGLANAFYVTLRGYGPDKQDQISVLCGETPPTITDGYALWSTVSRPLRTAVTTFQGYNPATLSLTLTFGKWYGLGSGPHVGGDRYTAMGFNPQGSVPKSYMGWGTDEESGRWVENDISVFSWMAGANFNAGRPPYVYVNTYGDGGGTTNLLSRDYQDTVGSSEGHKDARRWPWVIDGSSIKWGTSSRNHAGDRIYQEVSLNLLNYLGFSKPSSQQASGHYFKTSSTRDTVYKIASSPAAAALDVDKVADAICRSSQNNPVKGTNKRLNLRQYPKNKRIGAADKHYEIWVPSHAV